MTGWCSQQLVQQHIWRHDCFLSHMFAIKALLDKTVLDKKSLLGSPRLWIIIFTTKSLCLWNLAREYPEDLEWRPFYVGRWSGEEWLVLCTLGIISSVSPIINSQCSLQCRAMISFCPRFQLYMAPIGLNPLQQGWVLYCTHSSPVE